MTVLARLKIFATYPHDCSYLPDEQATTLFVDPGADIDSDTYAQLSEIGFRRSGNHLYRPQCDNCEACIPARIPAQRFEANKRQRRIWKRNLDLRVERLENIRDDAVYQLYADYINERHRDGDMYPPSREQYDSFLQTAWESTEFWGFYDGDRLIAVSVMDVLDNGLSAVYTFFDPNDQKRSLGVFAILWQIARCKQLDLPAVYLGYWIKQCPKMSYKMEYRPIELFIKGNWIRVN
jgi:arginine-tRNA-protein transferase